jgi:hypothetical protein
MADWVTPIGTKQDPNFEAGHDTIHYRIPLPKTAGPVRVFVQACFPSKPASKVYGPWRRLRLTDSLADRKS